MQQVATKETIERLGRVNFRKDFWDCNRRQGKKLANTDYNIQRRDRIENLKRKGLISQKTTLHVHHTSSYISVPFLHECLISRFKLATTKFYFPFWTWIWSLGILLQGGSPTFDKVSC